VPETAVNKNGYTPARKDYVWAAGQLARMEPIPVTHAEEQLSDSNLRRGISGTDATHPFTAFIGGQSV
jgi:hypothetical protein